MVSNRDRVLNRGQKACPCNVYPHLTPLVFGENGVRRGIPIFLLKFFFFLQLKKILYVTWACFRYDFAKTFDKVPRRGLLYKITLHKMIYSIATWLSRSLSKSGNGGRVGISLAPTH